MNGSTVTIGRSYPRIVVEWVMCVLVTVLFVETWLVKGVVVSCRVVGGSMAETTLGDHRNVVCADCGYHFNCGVDRLPMPPRAVCPNCGYAENDLQTPVDVEGERLLIDRAAFSLRPPRRWEVVALRQPTRAEKIVVKRIVGLPGESIEVRGGDVYVDGQIQRKSLDEQRALAVPVHTAAYRPTLEPVPPPRWRAESGERGTGSASGTRRVESGERGTGSASGTRRGWESAQGRFTHASGSEHEPIDWLEYHHGRRACAGTGPFFGGKTFFANGRLAENMDLSPSAAHVESPVTDLYGFNQSRPRREEDVHAVADLMLSFRLTRESGRGTFHVRATDGGERFEALLRFDEDRMGYEVLRGERPISGAAGEGTVPIFAVPATLPEKLTLPPRKWDCPPGVPLLVEVSLIDRQFLLAIDGRTVVRRPYEQVDSPPTPVSTPLAIGVKGLGVSVDRLRVYRDVYYTRPIGLAPRGVVWLGMGEYYVLGDNSPASADSRHWSDGGAVEANLLVGKPLAAISSVQLAPLPVWRFNVPNPAGIRYIQ